SARAVAGPDGARNPRAHAPARSLHAGRRAADGTAARRTEDAVCRTADAAHCTEAAGLQGHRRPRRLGRGGRAVCGARHPDRQTAGAAARPTSRSIPPLGLARRSVRARSRVRDPARAPPRSQCGLTRPCSCSFATDAFPTRPVLGVLHLYAESFQQLFAQRVALGVIATLACGLTPSEERALFGAAL